MKVKFTVQKMDENGLFGITSDHIHVWGNLNKTIGVSEILRQDLKKYPIDCEIENTINLYQFIVFVRLHTSNKNVTMLFFDAENNEDKAFEFLRILQKKSADKNLKDNFMRCFYNLQETYEEVKGKAELVLEIK